MLCAEHKESGSILFGVFDGHGPSGAFVAEFFRERVAELVFDSSALGADPVRAMRDALASIESRLLVEHRNDADFSGTTANLCVVRSKRAWVVNCGNSRLVIGRRWPDDSIRPSLVTQDHKPSLPEEKARIVEAGGRVFSVDCGDGEDSGPLRVWLGDINVPGLALSRSLGDRIAHSGAFAAPLYRGAATRIRGATSSSPTRPPYLW